MMGASGAPWVRAVGLSTMALCGCTASGDFGGKRVADSATNTTVLQTGGPTGAGTGSGPGTGAGTGGTTGAGTGGTTGAGTGGTTGAGTGGTTGAGTGAGTGGTSGAGTGAATGGGSTGTGTGFTTGYTPAPCDVVIPPDAIVVDTDGPRSDPNATFWVCPQTVFTYQGSGASIIAATSADVLITTGNNTVWLQSSSDLATFSGGNLIVYEPGASIDNAQGNPEQLCSVINIDTTNAPSPGC